MSTAVKTSIHPEAYITNHGLIKLIVLDALEQQGRNWDEFISQKERSSWKRETKISDVLKETEETGEWGQYSRRKTKKRSLKNMIGGMIPKKLVKVSSRPEPSPSKEPSQDARE